jgi:hypothetical protein
MGSIVARTGSNHQPSSAAISFLSVGAQMIIAALGSSEKAFEIWGNLLAAPPARA